MVLDEHRPWCNSGRVELQQTDDAAAMFAAHSKRTWTQLEHLCDMLVHVRNSVRCRYHDGLS